MGKEVSGLELRTAGIEPPDHFRAEKDLQEKDEMDSFESNFAKKKKLGGHMRNAVTLRKKI